MEELVESNIEIGTTSRVSIAGIVDIALTLMLYPYFITHEIYMRKLLLDIYNQAKAFRCDEINLALNISRGLPLHPLFERNGKMRMPPLYYPPDYNRTFYLNDIIAIMNNRKDLDIFRYVLFYLSR